MFERFTDRARRVVVMAQEEARALNHNYIGTEHILLGLMNEGHGIAARALEALGVSPDATRQQVKEIIGHGEGTVPGHIPFTPRAKKVLELSLSEARQLGHAYIGTEHILLGLIREGDGVAAQILVEGGVRLDPARTQVIRLLHDSSGGQELASADELVGPACCHRRPAGGDRAPTGGHAAVNRRARRTAARARAYSAVSAGRTPHSRRLSPRCQRVPISVKPAALRACTWVASCADSVP